MLVGRWRSDVATVFGRCLFVRTPVFRFTYFRPCVCRIVPPTRILQQGNFDEETVPVEILSKRGSPTTISKDEEYTNVSMGWGDDLSPWSISWLLVYFILVHKTLEVRVRGWACFPFVSPSQHPIF